MKTYRNPKDGRELPVGDDEVTKAAILTQQGWAPVEGETTEPETVGAVVNVGAPVPTPVPVAPVEAAPRLFLGRDNPNNVDGQQTAPDAPTASDVAPDAPTTVAPDAKAKKK